VKEWIVSAPASLPIAITTCALVMLTISIWLAWPWLIGVAGETLVRRKLRDFARQGALVLHDVILPDRRGGTVRIDHLLVSGFGIMAIQTIAYPGRILGSLRDAMWVHEQGPHTHRFANPLRRNAAAVEVLQSMLGSQFRICDAIVFTAGTLMGSMPENVVTAAGLGPHVCARGRALSDEKMRWVVNILKNMAIVDKQSRSSHVRDFMARQGLERHLRWAKSLMAGSVTAIVVAALVVGMHLAALAGRL
jgi:hypothetical protein